MDQPIETPRLLLRQFTLDDVEVFLRLGSDPEITRYTGDGGMMKTLDDARARMTSAPLADYARHGYGRWAVVLKATGAVIGFSGLKFLDDLQEVDVGYRFFPEYWGQGIATESARPAIEFGFKTIKLPRILGLVDPENMGSVNVLKKLGLNYIQMFDYRGFKVAKYLIDQSEYATCSGADNRAK